jgi:hypothetical protein
LPRRIIRSIYNVEVRPGRARLLDQLFTGRNVIRGTLY